MSPQTPSSNLSPAAVEGRPARPAAPSPCAADRPGSCALRRAAGAAALVTAATYLVGGVAVVSLVLGLHDRLRTCAPALAPTAAVFGLLSDPPTAATVRASVRAARARRAALSGAEAALGPVGAGYRTRTAARVRWPSRSGQRWLSPMARSVTASRNPPRSVSSPVARLTW